MENTHQVTLLVTEPLAVVGKRLRDVEAWTAFLPDVEQISKVSHERYTFRVVSRARRHDLLVAVREDLHRNAFTWTVLHGPCFNGVLRMAGAESGWTRVSCSLIRWPEGFVASMIDMLMPDQDKFAIDETELRRHLEGARAVPSIPDE